MATSQRGAKLHEPWRSITLVLAGCLFGGAIGWWVGGWTSCGSKCEPNVGVMEALGTWVGGLGTVGAVLFAVVVFRAEDRARRVEDEQRRRNKRREKKKVRKARQQALAQEALLTSQALQEEIREAQKVTISCQFGGHNGSYVDDLRFDCRNGMLNSYISSVEASHDELGSLGESRYKMSPGGSFVWRLRGRRLANWGKSVPPSTSVFENEQAELVVLRFEFSGKVWERRGNGPAEIVQPSD